jgi:archaellum biogenesis ATPase FlaH
LSNLTPPKNLYTAEELVLLAGTTKVDFLWENFIPRIGVVLLVGQPDTGKSQFAKQLSAFVANKQQSFLGFELSAPIGRSIYVSTEDDLQPTGVGISLQNKALRFSNNQNFLVRFLGDETLDELLASLTRTLKSQPCDLVTIDAFGDIFDGPDSNSNVAMRKIVKKINLFAVNNNCCVMLVHHLNKAGYGSTPSQKHVQGGSGLAQKVRAVMQLSNSDGAQRKFSVTKGNYTPKQYKDNWLELDFDDESLVFTTEGVWSNISTSAPLVQAKKQRDYNPFLAALPSKGLYFNELAQSIMGFFNVSSATASRVIKDMLHKGLITLNNRTYQLSSLSNDEEYDDSDSNDSENDYDDEPNHVTDDDLFD